ncbi:MAG: hypothetical protein E7662_01315 [Ruminococcaceae bacterium]|nr:hypothetical protein [Oscillospiraceae bacterium]
MKLSDYTLALLEDLEKRIDPETEDDLYNQWNEFWENKCKDVIFTPKRKKITPAGVALKDININDAIDDYELMLQSELIGASKRLSSGGNAPCVRSNYGTGVMTSLFGTELFIMPYEMNTLPTTRSLNDSDAVRRILEAGAPDLQGGFGKKVFDMGEIYADVFSKYPKIQKYVYVYHPDTQGPLDVAELLWGGEMFYEMFDDPDFVHSVLRLITDTYKRFLDHWYTIIPRREGLNCHWGWLHPGTVMIRNDSAMNLSPDMYDEFAFPYDNELLNYYGGGCVHFCGKGDHYIGVLAKAPLLYGINMSQPQYNDLDRIFEAVRTNGKHLLNLRDDACAIYNERPDAAASMIHGVIKNK